MNALRYPALAAISLLALMAAPASAQEMPNPRQMSGVPLPVSDVPAGTVTVRVIRGSFANPVASQTVELIGAGSPRTATTNEAGRAEFSGLAPGTRLKAAAVVGGERLESQTFELPTAGGIRLMLVAADPAGPPGAAPGAGGPAGPGEVVLGEESRFIFEIGEDGLNVFYVFQLMNRSAGPVDPGGPLVFDLPSGARRAAVLEGSSPQGTVAGTRLEVAGPFAPGATVVQVGYSLPLTSSELIVEQALPVPLAHVAVVAQKLGEMQLASPQVAEQRTMPAQGNLYIAGRGPAVPAGQTLRFHFTGVPHHASWPRNLTLGLAVLLLLAGAWAAVRPAARTSVPDAAAERRSLEERRDRLFEELAALEGRQRAEAVDSVRYAERRRELVDALERVYSALDDEAVLGRAS